MGPGPNAHGTLIQGDMGDDGASVDADELLEARGCATHRPGADGLVDSRLGCVEECNLID